jgi:hypothetical protein
MTASRSDVRLVAPALALTCLVLTTSFAVPKPNENDPNDPLSWPMRWKMPTYATICLFSFIANVNGSNFTVAIVALEKEFHITSV